MDVDVVAVVDLGAELEEVPHVDDGAAFQAGVREEGRHGHLHVSPTTSSEVLHVEDVDALVEDLAEDDLFLLAVVGAVGALQDDGRLDEGDAPRAPVGHLRVDIDYLPWDGGAAADAALQLDLERRQVERR